MNLHHFDEPIRLLTVKATGFPEGIAEAHQRLHSALPYSAERLYMAVSRPEAAGEIAYYAGATPLEGDDESGLSGTVTLKAGNYLYIDVPDYNSHLPRINEAFRQLLQEKTIDPEGYCVEWYVDNHLCKCMIRIQ